MLFGTLLLQYLVVAVPSCCSEAIAILKKAILEAPVPDSPQYSGYRFACLPGCSACCTGGPGYVWLSSKDLDRLAAFLELDPDEFLRLYCHSVDTGLGFSPSLRERADYSCIFLQESGCAVYAARPAQCRSYPFWESIVGEALSAQDNLRWKEEGQACPGIGRGEPVPHEYIVQALSLRRRNPPCSSNPPCNS